MRTILRYTVFFPVRRLTKSMALLVVGGLALQGKRAMLWYVRMYMRLCF